MSFYIICNKSFINKIIKCIVYYFDGILICSEMINENLNEIEAIFKIFNNLILKLNDENVILFARKIRMTVKNDKSNVEKNISAVIE